MVTAVDSESPHTAAKPVQPATPAMPMPPGRWPIHLLAELNRSTEMPEYRIMHPIRTNRGRATRLYDAVALYGVEPTTASAALTER